MPHDDTAERIIEIASRFFSDLGYDGTSLQMIADAVGMPPERIQKMVGNKKELYIRVAEVNQKRQFEALEDLARDHTPDAAGIKRIADLYLQYVIDHPEHSMLWIQRWLSDAADLAEMEHLFRAPIVTAVNRLVSTSFKPGVDPVYAMWMVIWSIESFLHGGIVEEDGETHRADDPRSRERFLRHLHAYIDLVAR
ncbi:TetR/AcrR family transcriptional regulator [Actinocorallia sp. B10E7]|uniref:TetR/AcrR family transcriptional regulator n=1 Tax=Actinocorallia sp. B10E7 TaxID=3153558 RepID=UPI00325C86CD